MKHLILTKIKQNIKYIPVFTIIVIYYLTCGCPSRFFFGVCCPGCGMTRAVTALMKFDFALAFEMHPLVFLLPFAALVYLLRKFIPKKVISVLGTVAIILMVTTFIIRLKIGSDVLYLDFEQGLIYKVFHMIFK